MRAVAGGRVRLKKREPQPSVPTADLRYADSLPRAVDVCRARKRARSCYKGTADYVVSKAIDP